MLRFPATRWGAFGGHLAISALIFLALCAIIYFVLFPGALFMLGGGIDGIKIVAGVDIVLGPLLTLVIYNVSKPRRELIRDLAIIGSVQIAALAAGMWVVYGSRPIAVSFIYDTFHATRAMEFERAGAALPAGTHPLGPAYYFSEMPDDPQKARRLMGEAEFQQFPISTRSDLMRPLPTDISELEAVFRFSPSAASQIKTRCIPSTLTTAFGNGPVCFDPAARRLNLRKPGTDE